MAAGSAFRTRFLLIFLAFYFVSFVCCLQAPDKVAKSQANTIENSTMKDLLKAVDKHFEKLASRIATLENTVSSLQFYSFRQFNQISGSLQSTNNDLGTVRKQMAQMEIDGRSQKIAFSLLGRDVSELKKMSSDLLSELESSMVYVHDNIDKQDSLIKTFIEDTIIQTARETTAQVSKQIEEILLKPDSVHTKLVNCSTDLSSISEHIDARFLEMKKQNQAQLIKQINGFKIDMKKNLCFHGEERSTGKERHEPKACDCKITPEKSSDFGRLTDFSKSTEIVTKFEEISTKTSLPVASTTSRSVITSAQFHIPHETHNTSKFLNAASVSSKFQDATTKVSSKTSHTSVVTTNPPEATSVSASRFVYNEDTSTQQSVIENATRTSIPENVSAQEYPSHIPQEDRQSYQAEEDEKIMNALYNMTTSVLHAVSYFRNTGKILEQILSNTDLLVIQQTGLNQRLEAVHVKGAVASNLADHESANYIPGSEAFTEHQASSYVFPRSPPPADDTSLSKTIFENVATLITNGSQLLEVITDLAQVSSVSLTQATVALEDEVKRLEGLRTHMATAVLNKAMDSQSEPVSRLTNATQRTFKLVEAVASNTGWIPLIFNSVQQLELLANRSLHITTQNQKIINQVQQSMAASDYNERADDPTINNRTPLTLGQVESPSYHSKNTTSKFDDVQHGAYLETIYNTSLQLNRIMPALSKFLAEREPLITLVGGRRQNEGRVEIYHKGVWGGLCHGRFTHIEADSICRHLGFEGGVSAGAGHFGPGSGVTWSLNTSCLSSDTCSPAAFPAKHGQCSHDLDAAVLCDHMLRIVSSNGSTNATGGKLEIHHKNLWLPVCGDGWTDKSAAIACQQMGFTNGSRLSLGRWASSGNSTWLGKTTCTGLESRLDMCQSDGWSTSCSGQTAAGVSCL